MNQITYDIKITAKDITSAKNLTSKTKRYSLKKELFFTLVLGICSVIFGFFLYFLAFILILILLVFAGLKIYNYWSIRQNHNLTKKDALSIFKNEFYSLTFDHEKLIFGKSIHHYLDIVKVLEDDTVFLFILQNENPELIDKEIGVIIPKRYLDIEEFKSLLLKTELNQIWKG